MNNIDKFFNNFVLRLSSKYPRDSKLYLYADYFELVSLFNKETIVSASDMLDRLRDDGIINRSELDEEQAERNDGDEKFIREIFKLLEQRSFSFGHDYPFKYSKESIVLHSKLEAKQCIYIFLLLASNLNLFKDFQSDLTTEFELVSQKALEKYLPDYAIVKGFGKKSKFSGCTHKKIKELAKLMNLSVNEKFLETTSKKGTQDLGLDVVGWLPFTDKIGNCISIFGQCTCNKDWNKKLNETRRYNNFLVPYFEFIHSLFIPYSLINYNESNFYEHHEFIPSTLLFERKRILSLISDDIYNTMETKELIEKCIAFEESIV